MLDRIADWDDAYANGAHIAQAERYPPRWQGEAAEFRARMEAAGRARLGIGYGAEARAWLDLFLPAGPPRGLAVFVHGGYWRSFDARTWSHLAHGPLEHGFAVALPSYTLCPEAEIAQIVSQIGRAIHQAAAQVAGPIYLAGHSAGGHLVTRMQCTDVALGQNVAERVGAGRILSLSGVHDLRPLLKTQINRDLRLDWQSACAQSPALRDPRPGTRLIAWVGAEERPEFLRQSALLANVWLGCGAETAVHIAPGRHHYDVIDDLADPGSDMVAHWLEGA